MQLSLRSCRVAARSTPGRLTISRPTIIAVRSTGPHITPADLAEVDKRVGEAIKEAEATCKDADAAHCAAAWDGVEELSAAASHKKAAFKEDKAASDPLEMFCDDNPDADECRVYED